jgi:hypothetical protein
MTFQELFEDLLVAWRSHEDLRGRAARPDQLIDSQLRLEAARQAIRHTM